MKRFMNNIKKATMRADGSTVIDRQQMPQQAAGCQRCAEPLTEVDSYGFSRTLRCTVCGKCELSIQSPDFQVAITLVNFHVRRGAAPTQRPLDDLTLAENLVSRLMEDEWPTPAAVVDFGIDSPFHLGALQFAMFAGCTPYDFDRVLGDGRAITALVLAVPYQPYRIAWFRTVYDSWDDEVVC